MSRPLPGITPENAKLTLRLETLQLEFLNLYTRHRDMVENESSVLTSVYLEKIGRLQLELLEKQTEASRLRMRMNMIQAAINRDDKPDLRAIDDEIQTRLADYYASIREQSAALEESARVLKSILPEEEAQKLKEVFRVLCKRLHPDLNPHQSEEEKDLFIRVKAAYDLCDLRELQTILLYLDEPDRDELQSVAMSEKSERIRHLEENIRVLNEKIEALLRSFPFTMRELLVNDEMTTRCQNELREQIWRAEEDIIRYSDIINIMCDE